MIVFIVCFYLGKGSNPDCVGHLCENGACVVDPAGVEVYACRCNVGWTGQYCNGNSSLICHPVSITSFSLKYRFMIMLLLNKLYNFRDVMWHQGFWWFSKNSFCDTLCVYIVVRLKFRHKKFPSTLSFFFKYGTENQIYV